MEVYGKLTDLPRGKAAKTVTEGCLILEGGGWRGMYTQGALDALMQEGIMFETTAGVSAGAMSATAYLSGQIGLCARINLTHRHDPRYCGLIAGRTDHGITGFSYLFHDLFDMYEFDMERFMDPTRKFYAEVTNMITGDPEMMSRDDGHIFEAIRASASLPYISLPVMIEGKPYLDGGCSDRLPYKWAKEQGFRKIMIIRTRDRSYRRPIKKERFMTKMVYSKYPVFEESLKKSIPYYNQTIDETDRDYSEGKIFVLYPSTPVKVSRLEGDMDKLGALYWQGYHDMKQQMPELKAYLAK